MNGNSKVGGANASVARSIPRFDGTHSPPARTFHPSGRQSGDEFPGQQNGKTASSHGNNTDSRQKCDASDLLLIAKVKAGDLSAFEELMRQYDRQIFRIALHITQNREDAEDIVQDTFLKAFQKLEQFQGNSKFSTWLVRIAVNESVMRLRKRKPQKTVSMDEHIQTEKGPVPRDFADWMPNPEQNCNRSELADILRRTIQGLPPGFRTVFVLRVIDGLSSEETAQALGLSVPAVKSRLLRARQQLRERLSRYCRIPTGEQAFLSRISASAATPTFPGPATGLSKT